MSAMDSHYLSGLALLYALCQHEIVNKDKHSHDCTPNHFCDCYYRDSLFDSKDWKKYWLVVGNSRHFPPGSLRSDSPTLFHVRAESQASSERYPSTVLVDTLYKNIRYDHRRFRRNDARGRVVARTLRDGLRVLEYSAPKSHLPKSLSRTTQIRQTAN